MLCDNLFPIVASVVLIKRKSAFENGKTKYSNISKFIRISEIILNINIIAA